MMTSAELHRFEEHVQTSVLIPNTSAEVQPSPLLPGEHARVTTERIKLSKLDTLKATVDILEVHCSLLVLFVVTVFLVCTL